MTENRYAAAHIKVDVEVDAYESPNGDADQINSRTPHRRVTLSFSQTFRDDDDLDGAINSFANAIREAARR